MEDDTTTQGLADANYQLQPTSPINAHKPINSP